MKCPNCGKNNAPGTNFCQNCGYSFTNSPKRNPIKYILFILL
ncbi:MAG: zinc-ribbon domain-containing protein, partial [Ligilactobacillus sp.]|nr:zinc-ribbon domain-containing protein [Ligilactobacillus sp.]